MPLPDDLEGVVEVFEAEEVLGVGIGAVEVVGRGSSASEEELDEDEDLK